MTNAFSFTTTGLFLVETWMFMWNLPARKSHRSCLFGQKTLKHLIGTLLKSLSDTASLEIRIKLFSKSMWKQLQRRKKWESSLMTFSFVMSRVYHQEIAISSMDSVRRRFLVISDQLGDQWNKIWNIFFKYQRLMDGVTSFWIRMARG